MEPCSEQELAQSLMRLWGKDAGQLARNYALHNWQKGDAKAYARWSGVERIVTRSQNAASYVATVSGVCPTLKAPRKRRARWIERLAECVAPAFRRLGDAAIRGTGI